MEGKATKYQNIDEYIASFPETVQERLAAVRATVQAAAPEATEKISYQMPTFVLEGQLVYFAAWKNHIGFYPAPSGTSAFAEELAQYQRAKGSIIFPHDQPLPLDLIRRITEFRVAENRAAAQERNIKKQH